MFDAAAEAHSYALLIIGVITSVIAAFFYLRVILHHVRRPRTPTRSSRRPTAPSPIGLPLATVLVVCVVMTIWVGVLPTIVIDFARRRVPVVVEI